MPNKTLQSLAKKYREKTPLTMLTAYDYTMAAILDSLDIDIILVGDSLGSVVCGKPDTLSVTMEQMRYHSEMVRRACKQAFVIADLPFMSYQVSDEEAVRNACMLVKDAGVHGVKLEGGSEYLSTYRAIIKAGVPVMAHIGLKPQSVNQLGGYRVQAKSEKEQELLVEEAKLLQDAGAFCVLLEGVPEEAGKAVTEQISVPTISVGAGRYCSGFCMVINDLLGITEKSPKFAKRYAELGPAISEAVSSYLQDVVNSEYPGPEHVYNSKK